MMDFDDIDSREKWCVFVSRWSPNKFCAITENIIKPCDPAVDATFPLREISHFCNSADAFGNFISACGIQTHFLYHYPLIQFQLHKV